MRQRYLLELEMKQRHSFMARSVLLSILLFPVLFLSSCKTIHTAGECPDTTSVKCLTERKCSLDISRNCMVCQCADPGMPRYPFNQDNRLPGPAPEQ